MTTLWERPNAELGGLTPADFAVTREFQTRWNDVDAYGHVNNAVYYEYFDTLINGWLIESVGGDPATDTYKRFVAESGCRYLGELNYPGAIIVGLNVTKLGTSSVTYELGAFRNESEGPVLAAIGRWVHVFVDAETHKPIAIPEDSRAVFTAAQLW